MRILIDGASIMRGINWAAQTFFNLVRTFANIESRCRHHDPYISEYIFS